jgi:hypothetical protein
MYAWMYMCVPIREYPLSKRLETTTGSDFGVFQIWEYLHKLYQNIPNLKIQMFQNPKRFECYVSIQKVSDFKGMIESE